MKYIIILILLFTVIVLPASAYDRVAVINQQVNITVGVTDPDFVYHVYRVQLLFPNSSIAQTSWIDGGSGNPINFSYIVNTLGQWLIELRECDISGNNCDTLLATSIINVVESLEYDFPDMQTGNVSGLNDTMSDVYIYVQRDISNITNTTANISGQLSDYNYTESKNIINMFIPSILGAFPPELLGLGLLTWVMTAIIILMNRGKR